MRHELFLGKIVIYHSPRMRDAAALVTCVLPDDTINATVFTDSGRSFAVYGVSRWRSDADTYWTLTEGDEHG